MSNKLISSYIDGSKIGRGSVWVVNREDTDNNKMIPTRQRKYDWYHDKSETEEYIMQPKWKVCFGKDTKILMADGTQKFIQDIQIGDEVLCVDEDIIHHENAYDNEWFYNEERIHSTRVTKLFTREAETVCMRWRYYDPDSDDEGFHVTMNHPFLTTDRTWMSLEDIMNSPDEPGFVMYHPDWCMDSCNNYEFVLGNKQVETVYNLETESHTYIAERLIVHNCTAETKDTSVFY